MTIEVRTYTSAELSTNVPRWETFVRGNGQAPLSRHTGWLIVLEHGLQHEPFCLEAVEAGQTRGLLGLALVRSWLFGRFLVSLPYLNSGGVLADDPRVIQQLIDRSVQLADELGVRYLELRHEKPVAHPALTERLTGKVHMRLELAASGQEMWDHLPSKVRNQIRKGQKARLTTAWGGEELLPEFYEVFSENMRDLGTPVFSIQLFRSILKQFPTRAELAVVRSGPQAVAVALLLHGWGISEVPSASSLRHYRSSNANMLLYWNLMERSIQRGNRLFDLGRSTKESSTYRFKKQWGARAEPAEWQYYPRQSLPEEMRPEHPKYQRLIRLWQHLPVSLTRLIGPWIVRGIP
jgi:FemAB-related protein (PEP-CTERM system-associated)